MPDLNQSGCFVGRVLPRTAMGSIIAHPSHVRGWAQSVPSLHCWQLSCLFWTLVWSHQVFDYWWMRPEVKLRLFLRSALKQRCLCTWEGLDGAPRASWGGVGRSPKEMLLSNIASFSTLTTLPLIVLSLYCQLTLKTHSFFSSFFNGLIIWSI